MEYPRSAVYKAQVKTASVAGKLAVDWRFLRLLPPYRNATSREVRAATAAAVRAIRARKGTFPKPSQNGVATRMPPGLFA